MDLLSLGKEPISADQPTGSDVRYEPEFEELQAEIDKMSNPAASGSSPPPAPPPDTSPVAAREASSASASNDGDWPSEAAFARRPLGFSFFLSFFLFSSPMSQSGGGCPRLFAGRGTCPDAAEELKGCFWKAAKRSRRVDCA